MAFDILVLSPITQSLSAVHDAWNLPSQIIVVTLSEIRSNLAGMFASWNNRNCCLEDAIICNSSLLTLELIPNVMISIPSSFTSCEDSTANSCSNEAKELKLQVATVNLLLPRGKSTLKKHNKHAAVFVEIINHHEFLESLTGLAEKTKNQG